MLSRTIIYSLLTFFVHSERAAPRRRVIGGVSYSSDLNGNPLSDGTRNFAYDDENQLTSVTVSNAWRSEFAYDGRMRRRLRFESAWNGSAWVTNTTVRHIY